MGSSWLWGQEGPELALPPWVEGLPCQRVPGHSHESHCLFQSHAGDVSWGFLHTLNPHFVSHWQCGLGEQKGGLFLLNHPSSIVSSKLSVTSEFTAPGSPTPAPISSPETPSSGKILASAPTTARRRAYSFIGIVPSKSRRRRQVPTRWGFFGAHLALSCLECIWLWGLGGFIPWF